MKNSDKKELQAMIDLDAMRRSKSLSRAETQHAGVCPALLNLDSRDVEVILKDKGPEVPLFLSEIAY